MSNNIHTNNDSQTLFRFTTLRNPELANPESLERRFVFRDYKANRGVFDEKINEKTTLKELCKNPKKISLKIETKDSLEQKMPALYQLAVWIARNKSTATKEEFDKKIISHKNLKPSYSIPVNAHIWDNLIYQVVTQKDFYAKEALIQILHAHHILNIYQKYEEDVYQDVIKAKIVLPKELFKPKKESIATKSTSKDVKRAYNHKQMALAEAKSDIVDNKKLSDTLNKLEEEYLTENKRNYDQAYEKYEEEIRPIQERHQKNIEEIDIYRQTLQNRIDYLTELSMKNPKVFYENKDLAEELFKTKDTLARTSYPVLKLPQFVFNAKPEIDTKLLDSRLNKNAKETLCRIFEKERIEEILSKMNSYQQVQDRISNNTKELEDIVLKNTVLQEQKLSRIGDTIVPILDEFDDISSSDINGFSIKTVRKHLFSNKHHIMIVPNDFTKIIVSGSYTLTLADGTTFSSSHIDNPDLGINLLFNNENNLTFSNLSNASATLEGEVLLLDGQTYTLNAELNRSNSLRNRFIGTGVFTLLNNTPDDTDNPHDTDAPNTETSEPFIPSGFGMKNIGIADYRKVEQSTYCYLEGDVSHIENVMAREYKEKATRRLKRSETQSTSSSESELEQLTDTTSTQRHEMQSEVAKVLQNTKDFGAQTSFHYGTDKISFGIGANYATHTSKEDSNRQAVTEAKEITSRALDRIVTKVKEERVDKIIDEYEENNKHGFDNTKGNNHVVGVYRWVDKIVKNQIYNYGKRMMFEFMIPEPAKLHHLGLKVNNGIENQLVKPVDPRLSSIHKLENYASLNNDILLKFWASKYNVELEEKPKENFFIGKSLGGQYTNKTAHVENFAVNDEIQIPEGYIAILGNVECTAATDWVLSSINVALGNLKYKFIGNWGQVYHGFNKTFLTPFSKKVPISASFCNEFSGTVNFNVKCTLTQEAKNTWLQKAFNAIISAYEDHLSEYEEALKEAKEQGAEKKSNPGFYRKIENTILRKNCISYMLDQNPQASLTFGKNKYYTLDGAQEETFGNTAIKTNEGLDQYAAFVKFMEQAFEWDIMSYHLYPYYWGSRKNWADLYQFENNDPIFRAFMQSGMARVIVTVRPGFEEAVKHFLATGQIWNGGETPVIDDPLFLSMVEEIHSPEATKEGKPWRERIPTALTILQANSIGLNVEKALPCHCEPDTTFGDNLGEVCGSNFEMNNNQIGQTAEKWMEITFNEMNDKQKISEYDEEQAFPLVYKCLGNTINIDRDATWQGADSSDKIYQILADELSMLDGIESYITGENGITFKVDINKIKNFSFRKPGTEDDFELFRFYIDTEETFLKILSPTAQYSEERILAKGGQTIPQEEYTDKVPLSKFLV